MVHSVSLLDLAPLPLVLRSAFTQQEELLETACNLLETCKSIQAAVRAHCGGLVPVVFSADTLEQAEVLGTWLAKNGAIVSSLVFKTETERTGVPLPEAERAEAVIAAALQQAAAAPHGLQLQACTLGNASAGCAAILAQLPGSCLTSLELWFTKHTDNTAEPSEYLGSVARVLPKLTQLRSLDLAMFAHTTDCGYTDSLPVDALLKPLSSLTSLTSLVLGQVKGDAEMQHLPPQLLELQYGLDVEDGGEQQLRLGHLTALTSLTTDEDTRMNPGYVLPPNLLELHVGDFLAADCLLALSKLQVLDVLYSSIHSAAAAELRQLSSLRSLTRVDLAYYTEGEHVNAVAEGWGVLPLKSLFVAVDGGELSRNTVQQLSKLQGLTRLVLNGGDCDAQTSLQDFAAVLRHMTALQHLELGNTCWQQAGAGMKAVAEVVAYLPNLRELELAEQPVSIEAAVALAKATRLTRLALRSCDLDDCCLNTIALGLTGLRSLNLHGNGQITDGVLPVLGRVLSGSCCLMGTSVTAERVQLFVPGAVVD